MIAEIAKPAAAWKTMPIYITLWCHNARWFRSCFDHFGAGWGQAPMVVTGRVKVGAVAQNRCGTVLRRPAGLLRDWCQSGQIPQHRLLQIWNQLCWCTARTPAGNFNDAFTFPWDSDAPKMGRRLVSNPVGRSKNFTLGAHDALQDPPRPILRRHQTNRRSNRIWVPRHGLGFELHTHLHCVLNHHR